MPDETLQLLLRDVRKTTIDLLYGVTDAQAGFSAPGLVNSILWHAGHAYVLAEHLAIAELTRQPPDVPVGWFETFSWKSQPATVTQWPKVAEVVTQLTDQRDRLATLLQSATEKQLARPIGNPAKGLTVRWSIMHALHDESRHQGEMHLLKKMARKSNSNPSTPASS